MTTQIIGLIRILALLEGVYLLIKQIQTLLEIALNLTVEEILKKLFDIVGIEYTAIHPKYLAYEVNRKSFLKELIMRMAMLLQ